ncbi:restriction system-associated AAA family ATPase [Roseivirga sp. BDSF3-8]|uniref:restriction system-associated AAA family ATPase n=1 Tax=Roseivirga sp. BDSF3-8 TaxID=3241598 RepID=UPI0035326442
MKLLRLKLHTPFRSLQQGFEVHFLRDFDEAGMWAFSPWCLAGRNGSGKSNIMEALAAIFYHLDCMYLDYKPESFEPDIDKKGKVTSGFDRTRCEPDAFELEYYFDTEEVYTEKNDTDEQTAHLAKIRIEKAKGQAPKVYRLNRPNSQKEDNAPLSGQEIRQFLPEYIIGYSSGENEILSLPFLKMRFLHYDEYLDRLRNELDYHRPEGRFIYADAGYSQAIFLANYLMQEEEVLEPYLDVLKIEKLEQFRIIIRRNEQVFRIADEEKEWKDGDFEGQEPDPAGLVELTSLLEGDEDLLKGKNKLLDKLKRCATTYSIEKDFYHFDYLVNDETKKAFRLLFDNDPVSLFQSFQILLTLNLFEVNTELKSEFYHSESLYVNETVPVLASDKRIMRFKDFYVQKQGVGELLTKSLSDGEHQFMHAIGLCLLFKDARGLFLLDEPETHLNPDWRARFISVLRDCLDISKKKDEASENDPDIKGKVLQDLLITSHSPFIISDCRKEQVLIFRKEKDTGEITCKRPDFATFGASVNQITIRVFGQLETIGDYAREELKKLEEDLDAGKDPDKLIAAANEQFGDSVEKVMFINKALDKKGGDN